MRRIPRAPDFDEVITGFRLDYGSAQQRFNIDPDPSQWARLLAAACPLAPLAAKRFMEHIALPAIFTRLAHCPGNPLAMAAGVATLRKLKTAIIRRLKKDGRLCQSLADILRGKGVDVRMPTIASMFSPFFCSTPVAEFCRGPKSDQKNICQFYKQMRMRASIWPRAIRN